MKSIQDLFLWLCDTWFLFFTESCSKFPVRLNRLDHLLRRHFGAAAYPDSLFFPVDTNIRHSGDFADGLTDRIFAHSSTHPFNVEDHLHILFGDCRSNSDRRDCKQHEQGS